MRTQDREVEFTRLDLLTQKRIAEGARCMARIGGTSILDAWANVLSNKGLQLTPLFRYCLARILGGDRFEELVERYETAALLQYQYHAEAYAHTWRGIVLWDDVSARARPTYETVIKEWDDRLRREESR